MNNTDVTEIISNLWLGNVKISKDINFIKNHNIQYTITIMKNNNITPTQNHLIIPITDKMSCTLNMNPIYDKTSEFINNALKNNVGILVHCKNGHHRSASVIASFMIKYLKTSYHSAVNFIHFLRPLALRRKTCVGHKLFDYYLYVNNKKCDRLCYVYNNIYLCECNK